MQALLTCGACGTTEGVYGSYEEWSDAASRLGWAVGEDVVICASCVELAEAGQEPPPTSHPRAPLTDAPPAEGPLESSVETCA